MIGGTVQGQPQFAYPSPALERVLAELGQWRAARATGRADAGAGGRIIVKLLGARGVRVAPEDLEVLLYCDDLARLDVWVGRVETVGSTDELLRD